MPLGITLYPTFRGCNSKTIKLTKNKEVAFYSLIFFPSLYKISEELIEKISLSNSFSDEYWKPVCVRVEFQISWY